MGEYLAWDIHDAALLLNVYLKIEKEPTAKLAQLIKLSDFFRKRAVDKGAHIDGKYRNLATLIFQYNKLRYVMSNGKYGYPGPIPPVLAEVVELYNSSRDQYEAIIADEYKNTDEKACVQPIQEEAAHVQEEINKIQKKFQNVPESLYNLPIQCLKLSRNSNNFLYKKNVYTIHELVAYLSNARETGLLKNSSHEILSCLEVFSNKYSIGQKHKDKVEGLNDEKTLKVNAVSINTDRPSDKAISDACTIDSYGSDERPEAIKNTSNNGHLTASCSGFEDKNTDNDKGIDIDAIKAVEDSANVQNVWPNWRKSYYLEDSIMLLPLSNHLANVLLRNRINTIGQFLHLSEEELSALHSVGKKTLLEAIEAQKALQGTQGRNPVSDKNLTTSNKIKKIGGENERNLIKKEISPFNNKLDILDEAKLVAKCHLDDKIEVLPLSVRLANILHRNDIHTVGQFISIPSSQLLQMRNLGGKTLAEAIYFQDLISDNRDFLSKKEEKNDSAVQKWVDELIKNPITVTTSFDKFPLPDEVRNVLIINNIYNISDLLSQSLPFWSSAKECNVHVLAAILALRKACIYVLNKFSPVKKALIEFMGNILGSRLFDSIPLYLGEEDQVIRLWKNELFIKYVKEHTLQFVQNNEGASSEMVSESIPEVLYREEHIRIILKELVSESKMKSENGYLYVVYPSIFEYVESMANTNIQKALYLKLKGYTLEAIGKKLGVTRERVRQILKKALNKRPKLEEDRYLALWEKYPTIPDEDFGTIFGWPPERFQYFHMISKSRSNTMRKSADNTLRSEALHYMAIQFSYNEEISSKIRALMKKSGAYFLINGEKVQRNRPGLIRYVVHKYCQKSMAFDDFLNIYNNVLKEAGLDGDDNFTLSRRTSINHLAGSNSVLWSRGQRLRYYDINNIDVEAFFNDINLFENKDIEISALKIFRNCPDVMREYDIRDEYELHNLLKKIWDSYEPNRSLDVHHQLTFGRMPILKFGLGNRKKQVLSLLQDNSPIERADLAEKYEELYGVRAGSVAANYFDCIEQYLVGSTYSVQWRRLPADEERVMKSQLTEDFYFVNDIRDKLLENFPNEKVWSINGHTLRQLGFLPYQDYAVSNRYKSAVDYFRNLLHQDVIDFRDKHYFYNNGTFYAELVRQKKAFEIVEVEPMIYYSRQHLYRYGIRVEDFPKFWQDISAFIGDGDFFTVFTLRCSKFNLPWASLKLPEWFYSSIIYEDEGDFVTRRFGRHRLFRKSTTPFSLADFISYVADKLGGHTEFHKLIHKIQTDYGFCPQKEKIKQIIRENVDLSEKVEVY